MQLWMNEIEPNSAWAREALVRRCAVNDYLYAIGVIALMALFMGGLYIGVTNMGR